MSKRRRIESMVKEVRNRVEFVHVVVRSLDRLLYPRRCELPFRNPPFLCSKQSTVGPTEDPPPQTGSKP